MSKWYFSLVEPEYIWYISYDEENTVGMINSIIIVT